MSEAMRKASGLVTRLREKIIADAFEQRRITDGILAERLTLERIEAADLIERLSAPAQGREWEEALEAAAQLLRKRAQAFGEDAKSELEYNAGQILMLKRSLTRQPAASVGARADNPALGGSPSAMPSTGTKEITTSLVDRLRDKAHCNDWYMRQEAADEIERLRATPPAQVPEWQARQAAFNILSRHPDCLKDDTPLEDLIEDIATAIQAAPAAKGEK